MAQAAAARLIAQQPGDTPSPLDKVAGAIQQAAFELSRWVGRDGCNALLTRAVNRAFQEHPLLRDVTVVHESPPALAGVNESVATNGAEAVAAALKSTLVELFELLVRVVGEDITTKLAEQMAAGSTDDVPDGHEEAER